MSVVKPYETEGSKKKQVTNMFDNISHYYDFLNHFLSLGIDIYWRKKAIKLLKSKAPQKLIDVATGTGDFAFEAHNQLKPIKITGIDISPKMLEIGREKIAKKELQSDIEFFVGDSENLQLDSNVFDAATVAFGVRNFENLEKGIGEIHRVLNNGGQLVVLEFSKPKVFPFKQLFNIYFRYVLPMIGRIFSKDKRAYSYLYESVQSFPDGKDFAKVMENVGFKEVKIIPLSLGICSIYTGIK